MWLCLEQKKSLIWTQVHPFELLCKYLVCMLCDGYILEENEHSIQIKINIKKLYGKTVSVSEHGCMDPAGVLFCGNGLDWEYGTNFCRAAWRGCVGREGPYSSLVQQVRCCVQWSKTPQTLYWVCKASGLRLVTLTLNQLVIELSWAFFMRGFAVTAIFLIA